MKKFYQKLFNNYYRRVTTLHYFLANPHATDDSWPEYMQNQNGDMKKMAWQLQKRGLCSYTEEEGYTVTESGKRFLERHADYIRFFNFGCPYVTIVEYEQARRVAPSKDFSSVMLQLLEQKAEEFRQKEDYEELINLYADEAEIYKLQNREDQALLYFLRALLIEQSGMIYKPVFEKLSRGAIAAEAAKAQLKGIIVLPALGTSITALKDFYREDMPDTLFEMENPEINVCTKETIREIMAELLIGEYDALKWQKHFAGAYHKLAEQKAAE